MHYSPDKTLKMTKHFFTISLTSLHIHDIIQNATLIFESK